MNLKQAIIKMLDNGATPKVISDTLGCSTRYPYLVRVDMEGGQPKARAKSKTPCNYEGPEGLKQLLKEYDNACKTIDRVVDFLLKENSDLKDQVSQFNRLTREASKPSWSPNVQKALVVYGD